MKAAIFYASAGHGHQKAAESLHAHLQILGIEKESLFIDNALHYTPASFSKTYPAFYYLSVRHFSMLWGLFYHLIDQKWFYQTFKWIRTMNNSLVGKQLLNKVEALNPEWVISTHFLTAELFARKKIQGLVKAKTLTVVTDFIPHEFWVNPGTDVYCVMSREGKDRLIEKGVDPDIIHVTGMPVHPDFYEMPKREAELKSLGMDTAKFTLLMTAGSFGLGNHTDQLKTLDSLHDKIQCFVVCGNNKKAFEEIKSYQSKLKVKAFGFVDYMAKLMRISDFIVAKPGGATTSESIVCGLPMAILRPIPGQESGNAKVLVQNGASVQIEKADDLAALMARVIEDTDYYLNLKSNIEKLDCSQASEKIFNLLKAA